MVVSQEWGRQGLVPRPNYVWPSDKAGSVTYLIMVMDVAWCSEDKV